QYVVAEYQEIEVARFILRQSCKERPSKLAELGWLRCGPAFQCEAPVEPDEIVIDDGLHFNTGPFYRVVHPAILLLDLRFLIFVRRFGPLAKAVAVAIHAPH